MTTRKLLLIFLYPVLRIVYHFSGAVTRQKDLWAFGSYGNAFNDNAKYLFIYLHENHPEIKCAWISGSPDTVNVLKQKGCRAFHRWSPSGIFFTLRARYWFVNSYVSDVNIYLSKRAFVFNLWHGIPLKKIEFDITTGPLGKIFQSPSFLEKNLFHAAQFRKPDAMLSTSQLVTSQLFSRAFRIAEEKCVSLGYPRLDIFNLDDLHFSKWATNWASESGLNLLNKMKIYKETCLYLPTWRDNNPDFIEFILNDIVDLNSQLVANNVLLVIKLHPYTPRTFITALTCHSNVHLMDNSDDIYPILKYSSRLVTDYSSVYFDYLMLDRPIGFYAFDVDSYQTHGRSFYFDYDSNTPGEKLHSTADFARFVLAGETKSYDNERQSCRNKFFETTEDNASSKIIEYVKTFPTSKHRRH